jgi:hypothetical protein
MKLHPAEIIAAVARRLRALGAASTIGLGIVLSMALNCGQAFAQHVYPSADDAAAALVDALKRDDAAALRNTLGENWKKFIPTEGIDREDVDNFLAAWDKAHRIDMQDSTRAMLAVGEQGWTLPIPVVKNSGGWQFDVKTGADEMRTRRIGRNELGAMQAALAYFDAQKEYARADRTAAGVLQYAQKFVSSPGRRDGLYWPAAEDEEQSPLGPLFATLKPGESYHGYRYKILQAQGKDAPGGAYNYLIGGRMVSGFALLASPLRYGDTGVMSFMISHDGQLYEKDLGDKTAAVAQAMTSFNPDASWQKIDAPSAQ